MMRNEQTPFTEDHPEPCPVCGDIPVAKVEVEGDGYDVAIPFGDFCALESLGESTFYIHE